MILQKTSSVQSGRAALAAHGSPHRYWQLGPGVASSRAKPITSDVDIYFANATREWGDDCGLVELRLPIGAQQKKLSTPETRFPGMEHDSGLGIPVPEPRDVVFFGRLAQDDWVRSSSSFVCLLAVQLTNVTHLRN